MRVCVIVQLLHIRGVGSRVELPMRGKCDAGLDGDVAVGNVADYFVVAASLRQGYVNG